MGLKASLEKDFKHVGNYAIFNPLLAINSIGAVI